MNGPTPYGVDLINKKLRTGELHLPVSDVISFIEKNESLSESLYDSTFITGVSEGDAVFSPVFIRGDCHELDDKKQPHRHLTTLGHLGNDFPQKGSGRLALAEALVHSENPLTARVMVNRIWHHLFGRGIVETVDNFGLQGKSPTHPELLDYLAVDFMENNWSVKKMIRQIVLSDAFKRSTKASEKVKKVIRKICGCNIFRSVAWREKQFGTAFWLPPAGSIVHMYGEPFEVYLTGFLEGRGRPRNSGELDGKGRRSIYQAIRRNFLPQMMTGFRYAYNRFSTFGKRNTSNVPAQSLALLNDPFVHQQAEILGKKNIGTEEKEFSERVEIIYLTAFARTPEKKEINAAQEFFE